MAQVKKAPKIQATRIIAPPKKIVKKPGKKSSLLKKLRGNPQAPGQAQQFVSSRSPALQYFIDVAALAFILAVLLLLLGRVR